MKQGLVRLPCEICMDHMTDYIRKTLDPVLTDSIRSHLDGCCPCRKEYQRLLVIDRIDISKLPEILTQQPVAPPNLRALPQSEILTAPDIMEMIRSISSNPAMDPAKAEKAILSVFRDFATHMLSFLGSIVPRSIRSIEAMQQELQTRASLFCGILDDRVMRPYIPALRQFAENILNQGILLSLQKTQTNPLPCLHLAQLLMIVLDDKPHQIRALRAIGETLFYERRMESAIELFKQAIELSSRSGEDQETERCLRDLGSAMYQINRFQEASDALEAALEISTGNPDAIQHAQILNNLACVHYRWGHIRKSIEYSETALLRLQYIESPFLRSQIMANSGSFLAESGDLRSAQMRWEEALTEFSDLNLTVDMCHLHRNIALLSYRIGAFEVALDHIQIVLVHSEIPQELRFFSLLLKGRIHRQMHRYDLAANDHETALTLARQIRDGAWIQIAHLESAIDEAHLNGPDHSIDTLRRMKFFGRRTEPVSVFYLENRVDAACIAMAMNLPGLAKSMKTRACRTASILKSTIRSWHGPDGKLAMNRIQQILDRLPNI